MSTQPPPSKRPRTLPERTKDEKGRLLDTPTVEFSRCQWCDRAIEVRARGRKPRFCSPACRTKEHRAEQALERAIVAQEEAARKAAERTAAAAQALARGIDRFGNGFDPERVRSFYARRAQRLAEAAPEAEQVTAPAWEWDPVSRSWKDPTPSDSPTDLRDPSSTSGDTP